MSANRSLQRLELVCTPVTLLRVLFLSAIFFSMGCLAALPLPPPATFLMLALTGIVAWFCWSRRCELGAGPVTLVWDAEGRWWWRGEDETELLLCGDSYLSPRMIILNLAHPDTRRRRSLVLFPASVGEVCFRRLSVRLLLEGGESVKARDESSPG